MRFKPNVRILFGLLLLDLRMDELKELRDYGVSIGLKDADLTKFITEQQAIEQQAIQRDERHVQRVGENKS